MLQGYFGYRAIVLPNVYIVQCTVYMKANSQMIIPGHQCNHIYFTQKGQNRSII